MSDSEIKELLEGIGYGPVPPDALMKTIRLFRKRKSAISPATLTVSDIVMATFIYDMTAATPKGTKKKD